MERAHSSVPNKVVEANIDDGLAHIEVVRNFIRGQYGNYDHTEGAALDKIARDLTNGEISVDEAKSRADGVFDSKNER